MPSYVFLLYGDESEWADPADYEAGMKAHGEFTAKVVESGATILGGEALEATASAKTVRNRQPGGEALVTDGPFAEAKESLGGFYLIETTDLDAALKLAALCPEANVEVRPIMDTSGGS